MDAEMDVRRHGIDHGRILGHADRITEFPGDDQTLGQPQTGTPMTRAHR